MRESIWIKWWGAGSALFELFTPFPGICICICIQICICISWVFYINVSISALCLSSYLHHICIQSVTATCRQLWGMFGQKYIFCNKKGISSAPLDRISSQLLFCISCPSVMRFAVSGINKQSGGSGNITECNSQGPKLIWARFGGAKGTELYLHCTVVTGGYGGYGGGTQTQGTTCCPCPCLTYVFRYNVFVHIFIWYLSTASYCICPHSHSIFVHILIWYL